MFQKYMALKVPRFEWSSYFHTAMRAEVNFHSLLLLAALLLTHLRIIKNSLNRA